MSVLITDVPAYAGGSYGVTHTDQGALDWLTSKGWGGSLLDVGCGPGGQVALAISLGWRAIGIDVDPDLYRLPGVALIDLCQAPVLLPTRANAVWSVEVAEHIPPEGTDNYLTTLVSNAANVLIMSANQHSGSYHINIQPVGWWVGKVAAKGMVYRPDLYKELLAHSTMQREFLKETGMVFAWT